MSIFFNYNQIPEIHRIFIFYKTLSRLNLYVEYIISKFNIYSNLLLLFICFKK